jgi:hypothetical protein
MLLAVTLTTAFASAVLVPMDDPTAAIWIVTLALLPLVNAVFDWLSYGITLWLLTRGHRRGWPLVSALADLAAAAVLFAALSVTLVCLFGLIDHLRGAPLIDVGRLLIGLRDDPAGNWWLVAMVASTLVPTLLHLGLAFVSAVTWFRAGLWNRLLDRFDIHQGIEVTLPATIAFTGAFIAYLIIPPLLLYVLWRMLWTHGGAWRDAYVEGLIAFAGWAGFI